MKFKSGLRGIMPLMLSACLLTTFVSCGDMYGDDDDSSGGSSAEEQVDSGTFRAVLVPENASVSTATGTAEISIVNDDLESRVVITGARATTHAQHVHTGTRCPTPDDDTNGDGVVDATEASAVYGPVLLALDSNLEAADAGTFPSGSGYNYDEDGSLAQILASLNIATLGLEGKVVNIHGVPESTDLPATVQGGKAAFPISCGILSRVVDEDVSAATAAAAAGVAAAADASAATASAASAASAVSSATAAAATGGSTY